MSGAAPKIAPKPATGYLMQIDGLRAVAIIGVLMTHFLPENLPIIKWVNPGALGVRLFFVISGFLITGILLRGRELIETRRAATRQVVWRFYARRSLRIFPAFYLVIAVISLINIPYMRATIWWHVTYLSNFWVAYLRGWQLPGHFWSLAVEEHFYLLWPALLLLLPKRRLAPMCIVCVLVALAFRLVVTKMGGYLWAVVMMPACLDSLALGALLALVQDDPRRYPPEKVRRAVSGAALVGFFLWIGCFLTGVFHIDLRGLPGIMVDTFVAFVFVWVVDRASRGFSGPVKWLLTFPPMLFIGRISYGIYLIHNFVPKIFDRVAPSFGMESQLAHGHPYIVYFVVWSAAAILLATISWYAFEKPINELKRYIPYAPPRPRASAEAPLTVAASRD